MTIWIGLIAAVITGIAAPAVAAFGQRFGLVDTPNHRSMHTRPTPRSGGVAVLLGMAVALGVAGAVGRDVPWSLLALVLLLALVGLVDDRVHLKALYRLALQAAAGAGAGLLLGSGWWVVVGIVVLPVAVNMINFMDGINGITCLTMLVWSVTVTAVGIYAGQWAFVAVGAAVAGSCVGFLPWNAPRARAFLGDGGSYAFGALVGIGTMAGVHDGLPPVVLIAPMLLYLVDTGSTLLLRAWRREPLLEAHRSHIYQRLTASSSWPHVAVSGLIAVASVAVTVAWWMNTWIGAVVSVILVAAYLAAPAMVRGRIANEARDPRGGDASTSDARDNNARVSDARDKGQI